nr:ral guanine nucleotide dissociation stimulator-like isoform X2 [Dasypus novemcinctus]
MQMVGEQLEKVLVYAVYIEKVQVRRGTGQGQRWYQRMNVWACLREEHRMVMVKAGLWENLAEHLVPAFWEGDLVYVKTFLGTYRVFTTTKQVLHLLFRRYGRSLRGRDRQGGGLEMRNTVSSLLGTWMDQYAEDFTQPPDLPCLKLLVGYAQVYLPGSALECRAITLLSWRNDLEPTEAEPKECRILKNNSFYAVISGLQSHSILHLMKMWEEVSRDRFHLFLTLSEIYSKENNYSHGSEMFIKEYRMVTELQQFQMGCYYDALVPDKQFGAWIGAMKQLSEKDSYHLFQELEPLFQLACKRFKAKNI